MIKNYTFSNFQSYQNECDVDFTVNKKTAHSYYDYELEDGSKIAKVMAVLGANGAGKSNLLKPLAFLSWFIPNSFGSVQRGEDIPIIPFLLNEDENTIIELEFVVPRWHNSNSEFEYKYSIELNKKRVVSESLKMKTSRLYSNVISRSFNEETQKYKVKNSNKIGVDLEDSILERAPANSSIISYVMNLLTEEELFTDKSNGCMVLAARYFQSNRTNLTAIGKRNLSENIEDATDFYMEYPDILASS